MNLTVELDSEAFYAMHEVVDPYGEHGLCLCGSLNVTTREDWPAALTPTPAHSYTPPYPPTCCHTPLPTHLLPHPLTQPLAATSPSPHTSLLAAVYRDRLTMPKLMICTGGDEFFQPDDSFFYWDQLKEPKFIR